MTGNDTIKVHHAAKAKTCAISEPVIFNEHSKRNSTSSTGPIYYNSAIDTVDNSSQYFD